MSLANLDYTSLRNHSDKEAYDLVKPGTIIEYSDPRNDCDYGNYGEVLRKYTEQRYKVNGVPFTKYHIILKYPFGREYPITAGQILAYVK